MVTVRNKFRSESKNIVKRFTNNVFTGFKFFTDVTMALQKDASYISWSVGGMCVRLQR
jgi:hypothetical protein